MSITFSLFFEEVAALEPALRVIEADLACVAGAFTADLQLSKEPSRSWISDEVGFPVAGSISMPIVNSRSLEATDGVIRGALAASRTLPGACALYLELDARIFRRVQGTLEYYPASGYWTPTRVSWIATERPLLVPVDSNHPPDRYRAWQHSDGDQRWISIEQLDGTEIIRVSSLALEGRTLEIEFELSNTRMLEPTAHVLILTKVVHGLLEDTYRGRADQISFRSVQTGASGTLPYS